MTDPLPPSRLLWITAAAIALVFLGADAERLTAPFGPSHDGFNAALFMTGGRAIVEEGPIASRLGALSHTSFGDSAVYAHHPPLIYLASAAAFATPLPVELAARLPAVLAALATLLITVLLLRDGGVGSGAAVVGLVLAYASPMFFVFGAVTQPDALGLLPMAILTLLWQRARRGVASPPSAFAATAMVCVLTSWEASLFAGLAGAGLLLENRRGTAAAIALGTTAGAALTGGWILWANHGDLGEFFGRAAHRVGAGAVDRVSLTFMVKQQAHFLGGLFPLGRWLVVPVAALGLLDRRTRPLVGVSLGTVLIYAAIFKNAASDHSYWLYALVLPLALGAAVVADRATQWLVDRRLPRLTPAALGGTIILGVTLTQRHLSKEEQFEDRQARVGAQLRALAWPEGQRYAFHTFGGSGTTDLLPWVRFYARREPFGVDGPRSVPAGQLVLTMVDDRLQLVPGAGP